ncbi:MAG: hypothetical protein ACYTEQ_21110, partial [Planctomycetota bacterium]
LKIHWSTIKSLERRGLVCFHKLNPKIWDFHSRAYGITPEGIELLIGMRLVRKNAPAKNLIFAMGWQE